MKRILCAGVAATGFLVAAGAATAQTPVQPPSEVEEVVVTARKRAENIQDVPMSVSAISGEAIERAGVTSAAELARYVPSLNITQSNNNRNSSVQIRGIGTSGTNPGIEASVGIFFDGVYMPAAGAIQGSFLDVGSVQVLRGPQGTLYGRNTPVGAVIITSREPTQDFEGMVAAGIGSYEERRMSAYVGGGLSDTLAGRLSFWVSDRGGYEYNYATRQQTNDNSQYGFRARLKWTPSDSFTGNFIGFASRFDSHCCTPDDLNPTKPGGVATAGYLAGLAALGKPYQNFGVDEHGVAEDAPIRDVTTIWGASFQGDWDLSNGLTLTSITAYNDFLGDVKRLSSDSSALDVANSYQDLIRRSLSEELRVTSQGGQTIDFVAGLYLYAERIEYDTTQIVGAEANRVFPGGAKVKQGDRTDFFYNQDARSAAVFGQATWNVSGSVRLTGGLRYSYDGKEAELAQVNLPTNSATYKAQFPDSNIPGLSRDEKKLTYMVTGQYDLSDDVMAYLTYATGFKTGGFNARSSPAGTPLEFDAETSDTIELGLKTTLFERTLVLNANLYRMDLIDFQESILNPATGSGFLVGNAGDRRVDGFEFDLRWQPADPLTVVASGSWMDAYFTDYTSGQCPFGKTANGSKPGTCNYNGLTPAYNPDLRGSVSVEWRQPANIGDIEWFIGGDAAYNGGMYLDQTLDQRGYQSAYRLYGLRLGFESRARGWRLSAFGKNLADEVYYVAASAKGLTVLQSGGGTTAASGFNGWYGAPRTFGVEGSLKF